MLSKVKGEKEKRTKVGVSDEDTVGNALKGSESVDTVGPGQTQSSSGGGVNERGVRYECGRKRTGRQGSSRDGSDLSS